MTQRMAISAIGIALLAGALPAAASAGGARCCQGSEGWGPGTAYDRMYDARTVETVHGEVVAVERTVPRPGMSPGVHALLKVGGETIPVHLGPAWFLERQDTQIERGDALEVTGSRVTFEGKPALIAADVKKGDARLRLRDENGFPVWSGWRRRR